MIIGCAIEVHRTLGAGLLESVYRECMIIEMTHAQLRFERERNIKLTYKASRSTAAFDLISSSRE
jgi:GxxExxY protein